MDEMVLGFDPGGVTGWSLWMIPDGSAAMRLEYGLIQGGLDGFLEFLERRLGGLHPSLIVCEKFNPDLGDANKEYDAMLIEGALAGACRALGIDIIWQDIGMKAMVRDAVLKENNLWISGPEVDWEDGRDVNDSQIHVLAYAKTTDHEPTVWAYWPEM